MPFLSPNQQLQSTEGKLSQRMTNITALQALQWFLRKALKMLGECLRYCSYCCCSTAVSLTVWLYAAYKPSHSMVGKKMESRWEPEPCGPTCYLIQLVSVDTPVCYLFPRINMPSVIPIHQSVYFFSGHFPDGPVVASLPSVVFFWVFRCPCKCLFPRE